MQQGIKARLSYANVIGTVALLVAVAGSALAVRNLVSGNSATNSTGSTWFIGGSSNEILGCLRCELSLPASGSSSWGTASNSSNDQLSPNATIVASDLIVSVDFAPGNGATRTFTLVSRSNADRYLSCDITGANTTCNSGAQTYTISPGSQLYLHVYNTGREPALTRVQYSWRATTP